MDITVATALTSPIPTKTNAITDVTSDAFIGSLSFTADLESHLFIFFEGKALSRASA